MASVVIQIFCWLALGVTALGASTLFGTRGYYNPEDGGPVLFASISAPLLIAVLLVLVHRVRKGPLHQFLAIFDGGLGLLLAGIGAYYAFVTPGDPVHYIWPLLLGLGLIYLAFESKLGASE